MIKGVKHISSEFRCEFGGGKYNSQQKWNSGKCQYECKKPMKKWYARKIMLVVYVLVSMVRVVRLVNS